MRRHRNAKIIATVGPASATPERLKALYLAGADVFRLNFSHGTVEDHAARVATLRALEKESGRPIALLADLQGPKLRVGAFAAGPVELKAGQRFRFDLDTAPGDAKRASLPHPEIFKAVKVGSELLIDDGKVRLRIRKHGSDFIDAEAVSAGVLSDRKGVNVPDVTLPISPLTPKDRRDLAAALDLGVDWVALSFVQRADDIAELKKLIGGKAAAMAKLEKPSAIEHLDDIVDLADGIMVARGDLGVELPPEEVPPLQKSILRACRHKGRPVVVATQMLDSMAHAPTPTRAEASDVATAIYDGADAVMLSQETASGDYPVESVAMMDRIIARVERDPLYRRLTDASREEPEATSADAISAAARQVAHTLGAACIVAYTGSGSTTLRAARERPHAPILGLTPSLDTARRMALVWGVHPCVSEDAHNFADMVQKAQRAARREGLAAVNDLLVIMAGVPFGTPGATNILRVARVSGDKRGA
jgi:pyruvate kinase